LPALLGAKDFQRAAEFAAQAQMQHPDDLRFTQLRAHALEEMGDAARAITVLEPAAKANPSDVATQLALADFTARPAESRTRSVLSGSSWRSSRGTPMR
jgi:predicted Zn-dependent protease